MGQAAQISVTWSGQEATWPHFDQLQLVSIFLSVFYLFCLGEEKQGPSNERISDPTCPLALPKPWIEKFAFEIETIRLEIDENVCEK